MFELCSVTIGIISNHLHVTCLHGAQLCAALWQSVSCATQAAQSYFQLFHNSNVVLVLPKHDKNAMLYTQRSHLNLNKQMVPCISARNRSSLRNIVPELSGEFVSQNHILGAGVAHKNI